MKKLIFIFIVFSSFCLCAQEKYIPFDTLSFDGKPFDAGLYKDLQAVLANKATRKGNFGIVEYDKFLKRVAKGGKEKSKLVQTDSTKQLFTDAEKDFFAFADDKYLYINHENQICRVCIIGTYIVFLQNAVYNGSFAGGIVYNPKREVYWLLDTRTGKMTWMFSKEGTPALLKSYPDLKDAYKAEKLPSLDYVAMVRKELKYIKLVNEKLAQK